jgi:hypothetical protein
MSGITFSLCSQDISKSAAHVVHQHVLKIGKPSLSQFLTVDVNQSQNASGFQSGNKTVRRFAAEKPKTSKFIIVSSMINPRPVLVVNRQDAQDFIFQIVREEDFQDFTIRQNDHSEFFQKNRSSSEMLSKFDINL